MQSGGEAMIYLAKGSAMLSGVSIVPGFGVNILSGPCLERKHKLSLSSNGRSWQAKDRNRLTMIQGPADDGGLYWARLTRLSPTGGREVTTQPRSRQRKNRNDDSTHQSGKRSNVNCPSPSVFGWSSETDQGVVRGENRRGSENSALSFALGEERSEISYYSDSSELSDFPRLAQP